MLMFGGVHVVVGRVVVICKLITENFLFLKRQVLTLSLPRAALAPSLRGFPWMKNCAPQPEIPPQPKRVVCNIRTQYRTEVVQRGGGGGIDALCERGVGTAEENPVRRMSINGGPASVHLTRPLLQDSVIHTKPER